MTSLIKSYGGVDTPSFLIIEKVNVQALPTAQIKQIEVPMKSGSYFVNKKYGVRTITASFSIKAPSNDQVLYYADDLAGWLDYDEPQPLVLRDKPDQTYYAIVDGSVDLSKFAQTGRGTITFTCLDPHAYGVEKTYTFNPTDTEPLMFINNGNTKTAPTIQMTFNSNVTDFALVTDNDMLYFGNPFDVTTNVAKDLNPKILSDPCSSTTGWTAGVSVDGGVITGSFSSNGYSFSQLNKDYGTGTGWHGASLIKSIGKQVQDFTCQASIGLIANNKNQVGRVEIYLLDVNGVKVGKMALIDTSGSGDTPKFEARAGDLATGKYFCNQWGDYPSVFSNFDGVIRISRKGKKWTAYIAKVDSKGNHNTRMEKTWTDTSSKYMSKVASIQIHVGAFGTNSPVNSMYVSDITVTEHLSAGSSEVDYAFNTGDILTIDNNKGEILRNGEPYFENLYPSSSFLKFDKGVNGISVTSPVISNGTVTFRERWL